MSILVVGIHTEPFGFNIWLDRGFGIITRLCVPFFFVASAYFYWIGKKEALKYLNRIFLLYIVWSLIYLPFDISELSQMSIGTIFDRFLWSGNEHALWYLCGTIIGFIITTVLLEFVKPKSVLIVAFVTLVIGCLKSTWSPLLEDLFSVRIEDFWGSRNGLFYGFPYTALGMYIAQSPLHKRKINSKGLLLGLVASLAMLAAESFLLVVFYNTPATIMWLSVFPASFFLFMLGLNTTLPLGKEKARKLRKISTLIYLCQGLFILLYHTFAGTMLLFVYVTVSTILFSVIVIKFSQMERLSFLKYLY